jgi:hypothetical protein
LYAAGQLNSDQTWLSGQIRLSIAALAEILEWLQESFTSHGKLGILFNMKFIGLAKQP